MNIEATMKNDAEMQFPVIIFKNKISIIIFVLLVFSGVISLEVKKIIPANLLTSIPPLQPLPLHLTLIRAWFYSHATTDSFIIALQYFSFWCFVAAIVILLSLIIPQKFWLVLQQKIARKYLLAAMLLIIFMISIAIRWPMLNRPLGARNEILTADTLVAMRIWRQRPIEDHYFVRNHTFLNSADRFIPASCTAITDEGDCFYVSYPPGGIILPYAIFTIFGLNLSQINLELFNITLHFFSAIFVYLLVRLLTNKMPTKKSETIALLSYIFYVFAPLIMVAHSNAYLSEMAIQPFFIGGIYFFLRIIFLEKKKIWDWIGLGFFLFWAVYIEWLGILLAGAISLYSIFHWRQVWAKKTLMLMFFCSMAALCLTAWQMEMALGLKIAVSALRDKFLSRIGAENVTAYSRIAPQAWFKIILHYLRAYDFILLSALSIITIFLIKEKKFIDRLKSTAFAPWKIFFLIAGLPILIHHIFLFQWTAVHPFSPLKSAPIITVLAALCFGFILSTSLKNNRNKIVIFLLLLLSILSYLCKTTFYSTEYLVRGSFIHDLAQNDEVIFAKMTASAQQSSPISNQEFYSFYSDRNVTVWNNLPSAKELLRKNDVTAGILFEFNEQNERSLKYIRFNLESTEEEIGAEFAKFNHWGSTK
jgi:hypothetical protein